MNIDNEQNMDMKQPADVPEILSAETSPEITSEISEQPHEAHHVHVHVTRHQQYENNHGSSYGETPIAPEITAPQEVSEIPDAVAIPETAEVPEAVEIPEVIEAPEISEVAGSYTAQETAEASAEKQDVQEWGLRRRGDINPENKSPAEEREPSYRDAAYCVPKNNMANMYSPGGHTRHHNHHLEYDRRRGDRRRGDRRAEDRRADDRRGYDRRATDNVYNMERSDEQEPVKRKGKRAGIGFLRAACIVLVCAIFSAAATYIVMEYRIREGYHTVVNQVVFGGGMPLGRYPTTHVLDEGTRMAPEDIYDMALSQVVGIISEVPTVGTFGTMRTSTFSGSGFIISSDGYILTNFHVVEAAEQQGIAVTVVKSDGATHEAEIIGFEAANDVALLKIDATGLSPVYFGDSDNIRVGNTVYAIGNPLGNLVYTMTGGMVSALDREVTVEGIVINTFQFDAAVNTGNSGGPIFNTNGEVIGIVTAKLMRSDVEGIGFAIPINDAKEIASDLRVYGFVRNRALMGITGDTVTARQAQEYNLYAGVFIWTVSPGSAADNAGIREGDIIVRVDNITVTSMGSLQNALRRFRAGETTTLGVWREGEVISVEITFDERIPAEFEE